MADLTIALFLFGAFVTLLHLGKTPEPLLAGGWQLYAAGLTLSVPLVFRRRAPSAVVIMVTAGLIWFQTLEPLNLVIPMASVGLALYSVGVHGRRVRRDVLRITVGLALLGALLWFVLMLDEAVAFWSPRVALAVVVVAAAWLAGEHTRKGRVREQQLSARTAELEVERGRSMRQAATEERLRIAQELHDVLGHHVSLMGIQAAAAQRVLTQDPARARDALEAIEHASRTAVTEVQRTLVLLRADDSARAELARLDDLVVEVRNAGIHVTTEIDALPELPASVDLAAARVVQESLTNVLRHAGPGTRALVQLTMVEDTLHVAVQDDARGTPRGPTVAGGGRGLVGLRERVELHGGRFEAGPLPGGGFRVTATVPLQSAPRTAP